jgi:hypothetical protein
MWLMLPKMGRAWLECGWVGGFTNLLDGSAVIFLG